MGISPPNPVQALQVLNQDDTEMVTAPVSSDPSAVKIEPEAKFELMEIKDTPDHEPCLVDELAD